MHAQNTMLSGRLILVVVVMLSNELIMMLPPRKYVTPVAKVVGDDRQSVSPGFHDRFNVVQRRR